jgi:hypothetical protein
VFLPLKMNFHSSLSLSALAGICAVVHFLQFFSASLLPLGAYALADWSWSEQNE